MVKLHGTLNNSWYITAKRVYKELHLQMIQNSLLSQLSLKYKTIMTVPRCPIEGWEVGM